MLLELNKLNKWLGKKQIFQDLSAAVYPEQRIGLVGSNGCGKSTLLKTIIGRLEPDQGNFELNCSAGYLPQFYHYESKKTVEEFLTAESYDYATIMELMNKFGFATKLLDQQIANCSGGEQTKLQLIKTLISEPELLLLDEPTNHLDLTGRNWLADYLNNQFQGSLLLVSHDRYFLDQVVDQIWELKDKKIKVYAGDYSSYQQQKEEARKQQLREYQKYQKRKQKLKKSIRQQNKFVNQANKGRKKTDSFAKLLKVRDKKKAANLAKKQKALQTQLEQLTEQKKPDQSRKIGIDFSAVNLPDQIIIQGKNIAKSFAEQQIFSKLNFQIQATDKIALLGKNGAGKSLLLKIIKGEITPTKGEIFKNSQLEIAYFSQKLANLEQRNSILTEVKRHLPNLTEEKIRTFLGAMLFWGEDVFKKIAVLSIGERVRVAFTILLLTQANFLLLDEPLNHLDIESRQRIETALAEYDGAFLTVTHDRYFAKNQVNKIWQLDQTGLEIFSGNYQQYLDQQEIEASAGSNFETELKRMKRAELVARLEKAVDPVEIKKLENELAEL